MWKRPFLAGLLLLGSGLSRIYISSLERAFLFSTVNILAIAITILGAAMLAGGFIRLLFNLFRHLWTLLTD